MASGNLDLRVRAEPTASHLQQAATNLDQMVEEGASAASGTSEQATTARIYDAAPMKIPALALALLSPLFLCGCDDAQSARIEETRGRLVGTWLREAEAEGAKMRLVIALGQDGKFTERSRVVAPNGDSESQHYSGEWSYDGTNFKRRYLQEDGRQLSGGRMLYATYQLTSLTRTDFTGKDNREGREISYRRVSEGTEP